MIMIDKVNVDKDLMFFNKDKGKKVYEIKTEIQRYLTFQVVADNSDEAFEKYLDNAKVDVVDDGVLHPERLVPVQQCINVVLSIGNGGDCMSVPSWKLHLLCIWMPPAALRCWLLVGGNPSA